MIHVTKRAAAVLALGAILLAAWYGARFEGQPRPVDPLQVWSLRDPAWLSQPMLLGKIDDPAAIYVVGGSPTSDGRFDALRLDLETGARSSARIAFGPSTSYQPFDPAEHAGTAGFELQGLLLRRPTPYLMKFPGPGGPGLELVDSATGVLRVVAGAGAGRRILLSLTVINSSRLAEMKSFLWSDRSKRVAAFLWPEAGSWHLYVFALSPPEGRIRAPADHLSTS